MNRGTLATIIIILLLLIFVEVSGQTVDHDFGLPIYWDANTESDMDHYGVYRSPMPCTDPVPAPANCPDFVMQATVQQGPDPIQWTEPGPVVFVTQDYIYRVTAFNTSGNESIFSDSLTIRWLNPDAPGKPGAPRPTTTVVFIITGDENVVTANFFSGPRISPHPHAVIEE
jgi:hypothetical protein